MFFLGWVFGFGSMVACLQVVICMSIYYELHYEGVINSIHCNVIVILPNGVLMYIGLFRREVLSLSFPSNRQYTSP